MGFFFYSIGSILFSLMCLAPIVLFNCNLFLICNLLRLDQEEIENRNESVTSTEVESVIKNPQGKVQDQMASRVYCTKHLEKELTSILKLFQKRKNILELIQ